MHRRLRVRDVVVVAVLAAAAVSPPAADAQGVLSAAHVLSTAKLGPASEARLRELGGFDSTAALSTLNEGYLKSLGLSMRERKAFSKALKAASEGIPALQQCPEKEQCRQLVQQGRVEDGFTCYMNRHAILRSLSDPAANNQSSVKKLQHDLDQMEYLAEHGLLPAAAEKAVAEFAEVRDDLRSTAGTKSAVLPADLLSGKPQFSSVYNKALYVDAGAKVPGPTVNPALDRQAIETEYYDNGVATKGQAECPDQDGVVVVDELLTAEAMAALRKFCFESTVWHSLMKEGRYLAAFLDDGFAPPLLAQIVRDLQAAFPRFLGRYKLRFAWAFKYDNTVDAGLDADAATNTQGTNIHADSAAVNVNFWITESDAIEDEKALANGDGGMVIYRKEAPSVWAASSYNDERSEKGRLNFVKDAVNVSVPYKSNRAILFNSNLLHETAPVKFKPGYTNRRINVVFLFGSRCSGKVDTPGSQVVGPSGHAGTVLRSGPVVKWFAQTGGAEATPCGKSAGSDVVYDIARLRPAAKSRTRSGMRYLGELAIDGSPEGAGTEFFGGSEDEGEDDEDGEWGGDGVEMGESLRVAYAGNWRDGVRHGRGFECSESGEVLRAGYWRNGRPVD